MATLRKTKGRYYAYFYDPDKKPKRKCVSLRTKLKSAAQQQLNRLEVEYARGEYDPWNPTPATPKLTITELVEAYIKWRGDLRSKTQESYRGAAKGLVKSIGSDVLIRDLTVEDFHSYIYDKSVSRATLRHRTRHLKVLFAWAAEEQLVVEDPTAKVRVPRLEKKEATYLTPEDVEKLLRAIDADAEMKEADGGAPAEQIVWLTAVIVLAVNTGLRRGELVNLDWIDIDLDNGWLVVRNRRGFRTKSGNERTVPLSTDAIQVLRSIEEETGPVIRMPSGNRANGDYVSKRFKHYVRLARLSEEVKFHSLRHTCASWLVQKGTSLPIVQAILGHSDIGVTQRYAHMAPDVLQKAMKDALG